MDLVAGTQPVLVVQAAVVEEPCQDCNTEATQHASEAAACLVVRFKAGSIATVEEASANAIVGCAQIDSMRDKLNHLELLDPPAVKEASLAVSRSPFFYVFRMFINYKNLSIQ